MYYDYESAVRDDVRDWCENEYDLDDLKAKYTREDGEVDFDALCDAITDTLWTEDSVTGNGSASYTYDRAKAAEYLADNFELLWEALESYDSFDTIKQGPEACDVTIRCYLLYDAVRDVVNELL